MQDAGKEDYLRPSERIGLDWIGLYVGLGLGLGTRVRRADTAGHLEYRMQRIHRIQRIWRYRDVGVRGVSPPSARWRRLGPLRRCNNRAIITNDAIGALLVNSPQTDSSDSDRAKDYPHAHLKRGLVLTPGAAMPGVGCMIRNSRKTGWRVCLLTNVTHHLQWRSVCPPVAVERTLSVHG